MKTVKYEVKYDEKANRLELFIRWFWAIPAYIVLAVLLVIAGLVMCIQFLHILILGKKQKTLFDWTMKYMAYSIKFATYFCFMTDERCPLMPED